MGETRAKLPFIGDQVGLFRAQPGRPQQTSNPLGRRPQLLVCRFPSRLSLPLRDMRPAPITLMSSRPCAPMKNTPLWTRTS